MVWLLSPSFKLKRTQALYMLFFFSLIDTTRSLYLGHWHSQFFSQDIEFIFWFLSDDSAHSILSSDISPSRTF